MSRRPSVSDDVLIRALSQSHGSGRLSAALDSLSLIAEDADEDDDNVGRGPESTSSAAMDYGSIEVSEEEKESRRKPRRTSSLKDEGALLWDELLAMIGLAIPVIATYLLEIVPGIVTIVLVGRLGGGGGGGDNDEEDGEEGDSKLYVDAAALAVMYFNIVGMSTGIGLMTALDTLYASAHGANQPSKMGKYLLTGIFVMTVTLCLVSVAVCNTTNFLLFFGQPPSVAIKAGIFTMWMLPGLPFVYAYELLRKLSQARNETRPMILAAVTGLIVNVVVGFHLVYHTSWGWIGAAFARSLGYVVLLPTLLVGMYHTDRELLSHLKEGFDVREAISVRAISKFLALGVPGMLQLMFEWWAFELIALLCGMFPNEDQAIVAIGANAVVFQVSTSVFMLFLGASIAGTVRIGNALGGGDAHRAKVSSVVALAFGTSLSIVTVLFILGFKERLPYLFTRDEDLISAASDLFVIVALFQLPDAINAVEQGIFRAIGMQSLAAKLNFVAYYVVGIPLGYVLGFHMGFGVGGLWLGMTAALCFNSVVGVVILLRCDWRQLTVDTRKRLSIVAVVAAAEAEGTD
ncbi:hypothetical protein ACHAWF_015000 [Thalassiosira exigua]